MNRTISKKLISVFLSIILVIAFCVVPVSDYRTSEGDSVAEAQTYQEQIDDKKDELGDVKAEQKEVQNELSKVADDIKDLQASVDSINNTIYCGMLFNPTIGNQKESREL